MAEPVDPNKTVAELAKETRRLADQTNHLATTISNLDTRTSIFARPYKYLIFSFLQGLFVFLGSTVGVALVLVILRALGYLPGLGTVATSIKDLITHAK